MDQRRIPRPQHILIAEDSDDIRAMWRVWLTFWGFTVDEARDGLEAVRKAQARRPDLVLMDMWMPGLDGVATTERLRSDPATADVPIVALSADSTVSLKEAAQEAGCDGFLCKPLLPEDLLEHLRAAFAKRRRHDVTE
jgi:CheY-like chemotaxis protein